MQRIGSIDALRGLVMILMALDHARDYFHYEAHFFDPTDLGQTTLAIFFTRWITHFCAPVFVFLAGTSAFLKGQKTGKSELSRFLLKRGCWLILLELSLVCFAWFFNPFFSMQLLQVIWVLGWGMILLAALIHLPPKIIFGFGLVLIVGHNLLDSVQVRDGRVAEIVWSSLHQFNIFQFKEFTLVIAYPLVPWVGVMTLGYCAGSLYTQGFSASMRRKFLVFSGLACILLFFVLRTGNFYGDPVPWSLQKSTALTVASFFNLGKYPPSLLFLLMTMGPGILFLAYTEKLRNKAMGILAVFGKVPLFYYLVHIYLLHMGAMLAAVSTGFKWSDMVFTDTWITLEPSLQGYGFSLATVYLVWLLVIVVMYILCRHYCHFKHSNRSKWWLSYL